MMSYERWGMLFLLVIVILLHVALLPFKSSPWFTMPGIIGAALIVFFADFIGFIFGQIIPSMKWPLAIRIFGWIMLLLDPILIIVGVLRNWIAKLLAHMVAGA